MMCAGSLNEVWYGLQRKSLNYSPVGLCPVYKNVRDETWGPLCG